MPPGAEEGHRRQVRPRRELLLRDLVDGLLVADLGHRPDAVDVQADVVAGLELDDDVLVVEGLAAGQDDALEDAARVVRGQDVAPDADAEGLEPRPGPALVALEGIGRAHRRHLRGGPDRLDDDARGNAPPQRVHDLPGRVAEDAAGVAVVGLALRGLHPAREHRAPAGGLAVEPQLAEEAGQALPGASRHPAHQDRPGLAARRARRERAEELDPRVLGDAVDGHPGPPQALQPLAEEEGRGAQVGARLRHHAVHERRAAAPDEVVDDRHRDPGRHVARLPLPGPLGERRAEPVDALARDPRGRRVGVRVHAVGPGQDPLEVGRAVGERLPRLVGDAVGRVHVAQADLVRRRAHVALGPPDDDEAVLLPAPGRRPQPREVLPRLPRPAPRSGRGSGGWSRPAITRTRPAQLVGERPPRLGRPGERAGEAGQAHGEDAERPLAQLEAAAAGPGCGRTSPTLSCRSGARDDEPTNPVTSVVSTRTSSAPRKPRRWSSSRSRSRFDLPPGLAVDEPRRPARLRHALDLDAPPAAHGDVHVLPARPHPHPHVPRRAADAAHEQDRLLDLVRRPQVGAGHRLDERHAEPVGAPDDEVALVRDLAAGVLLDAHLGDRERRGRGRAACRSPPRWRCAGSRWGSSRRGTASARCAPRPRCRSRASGTARSPRPPPPGSRGRAGCRPSRRCRCSRG